MERPCEITDQVAQIRGFHHCYGGSGALGPTCSWLDPSKCTDRDAVNREREAANVSQGFNFGVILLPYLIDWGDRRGIMTWHKVYATALHSFARPEDRLYAFLNAEAFVSPKDKYVNRLGLHLIGVKPFAGWRWYPQLLQKWLDYADGVATGLGEPGTLDAGQSGAAALAWIAAVLPLWQLYTIERFPYGPRDLASFWRQTDVAAALS